MGFLTEYFTNEIEAANRRIKINASFDTVLEIQNLFQEESLTEVDKIKQALKMLVVNEYQLIGLSLSQQADLLTKIFKECINIKNRGSSKKDTVPIFDFEKDGEYIYSSFMSDYGIDLLSERGKLHWKKFIALFSGLSEHTKIMEVIKIRTMKVPRYNGHNQDEIQAILDLKSCYALDVKGHGGQEGLDTLFMTLERMAVTD
ncbi:hypothetical protein C3B58_15545 [Lactonifactor longoviformis]|uniref:Bacteriophage Gp15 protein n=1 Tax=Lactonifactor longoviformis DSM 17459 TaxID=1122155 RepID=A0A1M4TR02_9CLOT|nr:Gp15 family bacteriophage protein [Lactonifactor longoviformis]POP31631.1 hypothetical protein C3B58_15545 [Lactonifactor longoviformis]SHE46697.1 Bacteriophage Gp15 protein [Lactonifactor longoviformis DSM 17459]